MIECMQPKNKRSIGTKARTHPKPLLNHHTYQPLETSMRDIQALIVGIRLRNRDTKKLCYKTGNDQSFFLECALLAIVH
jgi:hypothetical protein